MDTLTAANLLVGHATGTLILLFFAWLLVSDVFVRRAITRAILRVRQRPARSSRSVKTAENVTP